MGNNTALPFDLRLPLQPETNDQQLAYELSKVYNAIRNTALWATDQTGAIARPIEDWASLLPSDTIKTQNLNRVYVKATEALAFGELVKYELVAGVFQARKANANSATPYQAQGFCSQIGGIALGAYGETQCGIGLCTGITGLTVGTAYYLSTVAGLITNSKPIAPNIQQPVGFALGVSLLYFMCPPV